MDANTRPMSDVMRSGLYSGILSTASKTITKIVTARYNINPAMALAGTCILVSIIWRGKIMGRCGVLRTLS
jgi:hypothetical protein